MNDRLFFIILLLIVVFAATAQVVSIDHGLPEIQIGDENSDLSHAVGITQGQLMPRHQRFSRALIAYVDLIAVGGLFGYTYLSDQVQNVNDFQDLYFSDRWLFTLATRLLMTALMVVTIILVALSGRYISNTTGVFAASMLALNGFYGFCSLFALPDILVPFTVALAIWLMMRLWKYRRRRDYVFVGLSMALVMLAKLNATPIGISFLIVHGAIVREHTNSNWRDFPKTFFLNIDFWTAIAAGFIGSLLFNPLILMYPGDVVYGINFRGRQAYGIRYSLGDHLLIIRNQLLEMVGLIWRWYLLPTVIGIGMVSRYRKNVVYWVILAAFLVLFLTMANVVTVHYKVFYWTPWIIPMALLSGVGLAAMMEFAKRGGWRQVVYGAVGLILVLEGAFLLQILSVVNRDDTRQLALAYIHDHLPEDTRVMSGDPIAYSIPFQRNEASIQRARKLTGNSLNNWDWWLAQPEMERPGPAYDVYGPEMQAVIDSFDDVHQVIQSEGIAYYIEANFCLGFGMTPDSSSALDFPPYRDDLVADWQLVAVFSPFATDECIAPLNDRGGLVLSDAVNQQIRMGPLIRIYRVG